MQRVTISLLALIVALVLSGLSGLINQVIWQRALRLYLAGSESLSGMIVILVFLLGLSLGAALAARFISTSGRVVFSLACVEFALALLNLAVFALLRSDLSASVQWLQSLSDILGVSLRWTYTLVAGTLLLPPCTLMGMTTPLAAEAIQRLYNGQCSSAWLSRIFGWNTFGACAGAVLAGFYCLPVWGQSAALLVASACNGLAGLLALSLVRAELGPIASTDLPSTAGGQKNRIWESAFLLGLVSLSYEMWLLRALSLAWLPLPSTFSICLGFFLFCWNLGVACSEFLSRRGSLVQLLWLIPLYAAVTGLEPVVLNLDRQGSLSFGLRILYFLPCMLSGLIYGLLIAARAQSWGRDTGEFVAWNTLGSGLGVLLGYSLGYRVSPLMSALVQMAVLAFAALRLFRELAPTRRIPVLPGLGLCMVAYLSSLFTYSLSFASHTFYTSDGVLEIRGEQVFLDGLWHSAFSYTEPNNNDWAMAALPALAHANPEKLETCLVVGFSMGHTARALLHLPSLRKLDCYEINRGFQELFEAYPKSVGSILNDPRLSLHWQDGRSGLSLRDTKYDLITSAPLHLNQSGSSLLLSENYFELLRKRLKPGGVVACYARAGTNLQGILVRQTFARVFPHRLSLSGGYLLIGSNQPFDLRPEMMTRRLALPGLCQKAGDQFGPAGLLQFLDREITWSGVDVVISDDRPLVEYPHWIPKFVTP